MHRDKIENLCWLKCRNREQSREYSTANIRDFKSKT